MPIHLVLIVAAFAVVAAIARNIDISQQGQGKGTWLAALVIPVLVILASRQMWPEISAALIGVGLGLLGLSRWHRDDTADAP